MLCPPIGAVIGGEQVFLDETCIEVRRDAREYGIEIGRVDYDLNRVSRLNRIERLSCDAVTVERVLRRLEMRKTSPK